MTMEKPYVLYDNRLDDGTPTATTTAAGYSALNLNDWRTYTYWKAGSNAIQYITIDCGSAKAADSLAILSHDLFTQTAQISVECSSDNFGTDITVALAAFSPTSNKAIFKTFASQTKRYWRLKITNLTAACYVAILDIGARLGFNRYILEGFDPIGETVKGESLSGVTGQLLGSAITHIEKAAEMRFKVVADSWFNNSFLPAWDNHLSKLKPFFFIWNYTNYPNDVRLAVVKPDTTLQAPYAGITRSFTLSFVGVKE